MRAWGAAIVAAACALAAGPAQASFVASSYPVENDPFGVAAADVDGDGRRDLAVANATASKVSVLRGRPDGTFAPEGPAFATAGGPNSIAVADVNADARPDLVVPGFDLPGQVAVHLRDAGGFVPEAASPYPSARASAIAVGDFNGDGRPDLAVPDHNGGAVSIHLRNGAGTAYTAEGSVPVGTNPRDVAAADFNGDGRSDFATTNQASGTVSVKLRNGANTGFVNDGGAIVVPATPWGIAAGDVNGDGRPDLVVAGTAGDVVTVLHRLPAGGFAAAPGSPFGVGDGPLQVALADLDRDGRLDIATADNGGGTVSVLLRRDDAFVREPSSPIAIGPASGAITASDLDGDGWTDLAATLAGTADDVVVLRNTTALDDPPGGSGPPPPPGPVATTPPGPAVVPRPSSPRRPLLARTLGGRLRTGRRTARFVALSVAPARAGDVVRVSCRGRGCPARAVTVRVRRDARRLSLLSRVARWRPRSGAVVELRVSRPGFVGRVVRWTVRAPRSVRVARLCLPPGAARPRACSG